MAKLECCDRVADGLRLTCFATNTTDVPIAALELRHRQRRARAAGRTVTHATPVEVVWSLLPWLVSNEEFITLGK
ncbi:hypothetical protein [Streptomyces sp. NPDC053813]|uniref:hypothetical protein n=1 Tax=Streptomyces sp. NPDC053813 TaxID=3365717 RepID=UPI0037D4C612